MRIVVSMRRIAGGNTPTVQMKCQERRAMNKAPLCDDRSAATCRRDLSICYLPIAQLKPHARNARTHSRKQIKQIAESIKAFGFTNPVLLDGDHGIIAGHGRVEAAKLLGIPEVPTIRLDAMSEAQKRAYVIADNKLAENAGWDRELLALELQYIANLDVEFDLTVTGLEVAEIDVLINASRSADPKADLVPEVEEGPAVSRDGDLWQLGSHRLACGDARDPLSCGRLMGGKRAQMVFTDPPYNVAIDGHVCGLGRVKHDNFVMAVNSLPTVTPFSRPIAALTHF
jgi:hypothetical protein